MISLKVLNLNIRKKRLIYYDHVQTESRLESAFELLALISRFKIQSSNVEFNNFRSEIYEALSNGFRKRICISKRYIRRLWV